MGCQWQLFWQSNMSTRCSGMHRPLRPKGVPNPRVKLARFIPRLSDRSSWRSSSMAQPVLVIHGAGEPRRRGRKVYWEPMLADGLGPDYRVRAPRMPQPTDPQYRIWSRRIGQLIADNPNPVLVGHSFGASVLLKYFAEAALRPSFTGLFLIATPLWGPDFPEFALPPDFGDRLRNVSPLYLYHSRDDAEIRFEHLERLGRALPQAIVRALDGRGHEFNQPQFPELVADIRGLNSVERAV
ncbi:MAG TPA: alpha/beta fold hydrolase [Gemmatimonadales bacterium]|nr:alpha/beta fold hydrolase [Gemmatimonadales bacterium]